MNAVRQLLVVSIVGLLIACFGGTTKPAAEPVVENKPSPRVAPAPPPPTAMERAFAKMEDFERALCACTTPDCAKQVSDEMTEWGHAESQALGSMTMSEAEQKRALEIGTHMGECLQKAMTAGQP